jgi:flagellar biosynthesis protein FlhG
LIADQAAGLRDLMAPPAPRGAPRTRVIAVSSGKGGVGKTTLTINLALSLARDGRKIVILDGDLGLANVDVMLGLVTRWNLGHVVSGERELAEVLQPVARASGVWVIPGGSGLEELANLSDERRAHLIRSMAQLDGRADLLLIDTAAGISTEVSSFLAAAPELIVVTTPDPTAITDAYALIKVAARVSDRGSTIRLVVNQVNDVGEAREVARKIVTVAREFLNVDVRLLGHVPHDPYVGRAIRRQLPIALSYPSSPAALAIAQLGKQLTGQVDESRSSIIGFLKRMAGLGAPASAELGAP